MRTLYFLFSLLVTTVSYSQTSIDLWLDSTVTDLKANNAIDKNDQAVFNLLEQFYEEALQSDKGELTPTTLQKLSDFLEGDQTKNKHLLILFFMYQDHISQTAAKGLPMNIQYQLACINLLEKEIRSVYPRLPAIVYIYKAEANNNAGMNNEAGSVIELGLQYYPSSIPMKVYKYLATKDVSIKDDLVKNHFQHWMVLQFGIK